MLNFYLEEQPQQGSEGSYNNAYTEPLPDVSTDGSFCCIALFQSLQMKIYKEFNVHSVLFLFLYLTILLGGNLCWRCEMRHLMLICNLI